MNRSMTVRAGIVAVAMACAAQPATAQDSKALTTAKDVRAEISEAMQAVTSYSEQKRDEALTQARKALDQLDAEIERREQALREKWAEMSEKAREDARARLRDLREARSRLGERYGALQSGASSAWDELKAGFSDAWDAFSKEWTAADAQNSAR